MIQLNSIIYIKKKLKNTKKINTDYQNMSLLGSTKVVDP